MAKLATLYYSSTGHTSRVAQRVEEETGAVGTETRLRKVRELAPEQMIATIAGWEQYTQHEQQATLNDLEPASSDAQFTGKE